MDLEVVAADRLGDPVGGVVVAVRDVTDRTRLESHGPTRWTGRHNALIEALADGSWVMVGDVPDRDDHAADGVAEVVGRHDLEVDLAPGSARTVRRSPSDTDSRR